jgi:hypothetical protein
MKFTKRLMMVGTLGIAGLMAIPASAQWNPWGNNSGWHRDRDHDRDRDWDRDRDHDRNRASYGYGQNGSYSRSQSSAYQQGVRDGQWDRQHGPQRRSRNWRNNGDAQAYRQGYSEGYNGSYGGYGNSGNNNGRWGTWGNRNGYPNGSYGGYGNGAGAQRAQQMGYQDGLSEGSKDAQTGHSYRPTESPAYKDADHGQSVSGVSKDQYKQLYRNAYMQGYQRGYGSRGGYGRR